MTDTQSVIFDIIANILGVETTDISAEADFTLDLNATLDDMNKIRTEIESSLDIILPEFDEEGPITVGDLLEIVEDSLL